MARMCPRPECWRNWRSKRVWTGSARAKILASDEYAQAVREQENFYTSQGITAVPSVIFNDRHLVQGGQPVELFEQALRQLAGIPAPPKT